MRFEEKARRILPQGRALPDDIWLGRHRGILFLLWGHALVVPIYALIRGFPVMHALGEGMIIPGLAILATASAVPRRARTLAASLGLLSSSAILVHLSGGLIEMHFHFFVMVATVALYQDWLPFLASIGYVVVHHGALGALDPSSVFNHPAAISQPWKWAFIHGLFVTGISLACLVTWRLNELMMDQRRAAEESLRREKGIVETLHDVGRSLAAELDLESVMQRVTDAGSAVTGAAFGAFFYEVENDDREPYRLSTIAGSAAGTLRNVGIPENTPLFEETFAERKIVRLDDVGNDPRYQAAVAHLSVKGQPIRSYLSVPVISRTGQVIGGLLFGHPDRGVFTADQERIATGIASHASVALDNARLYELQKSSRTVAEAATRRMSLIAGAGQVLWSSLEPDEILKKLAALLVPAVADAATVDLVDDEGSVRRVAAAGVEAEGDLQDLSGNGHGAGRFSVSAAIPMRRRGRTLGTITIAMLKESARSLAADDVHVAEEIVRRAGVALENARLYQAQRDLAATLQHSLLPEDLPEIPGVATAVRYIPGGPGVDIGGDWYDVLELANGSLGLAMGDVVGRGIPAASLMGQLRNALRAYAVNDASPGSILRRVNALLAATGSLEQMATLVYAVFDPETGVLTLANAGHPPPLVLGPDGSADWISGATGPPLGAMKQGTFNETTVSLEPGATLLLYTDGLVEDRETPIEEGLAALRSAAVSTSDCSVDELCERVIENSRPRQLGRDDTALLALRYLPVGDRLSLRLPATPGSLKRLRAAVRRWLRHVGATQQESYEILAAVGEASANAIQHSSGPLGSTFDFEAERNAGVHLMVRSRGRWRDPRPDEDGRGIEIMRTFMDDVRIEEANGSISVAMFRLLAATHDVKVPS